MTTAVAVLSGPCRISTSPVTVAYILPGARKFMRVEGGSPALPGAAQMDIQFDDGTVQSQAVLLP